jgi:hypothetical protein
VHVREVEAAQLVEAGRDLEQAGDAVEPALSPEAGVGGIGGLAGEKAVALQIPDNSAALTRDRCRLEGGDEAPAGVGEVLVFD